MALTNLKLGLMLGLLLSASIIATNIFIPWLTGHPTADTNFSESIGWVVVVGIICLVGFKRVRTTASVLEATWAGGAIALIAFAVAMVTFLIIDDLFVTIVSQQPEKIWLFRHSGYSDMRTYLNHTNLRAFWTVLPIITAAGAFCGLMGGYLAQFLRAHVRSGNK